MLLQLFAKNCPKLPPSFFPCHNDGFFRKPTSPPLPLREGSFLKSPRPSFIDKAGCTRQFESELSLHSFAQLFSIKEGSTAFPKPLFSWRRLAALGNLKASFHCPHLHNLSPQGTGDVSTALLGAQTASL